MRSLVGFVSADEMLFEFVVDDGDDFDSSGGENDGDDCCCGS